MEIKGNWYLYYQEFDNMENHVPEVEEHIRLLGETTQEVYEEASQLWAYRTKNGFYKGYDGNLYPHSPTIHQVININPATFQLEPVVEKPFSWSDIHSNEQNLRNRLIGSLKRLNPRPNLDSVMQLIKEADLTPSKEFSNLILPTQRIIRSYRWDVIFSFRENLELKNIFPSHDYIGD